MISTTIDPRGSSPLTNENAFQNGPIVVATDGSTGSDAALQAAGRLATLHDAKVVIVSVVEPVVPAQGDFEIAFPYDGIEQAQRSERMTMMRAQLERVGARDAGWTMRMEYGDPAHLIATVVQEVQATMVITGLSHHDLLDRLLGSETALRIVRASKVPVLAVTTGIQELPKRAVIATDFSVASLDSAGAALRLFPSITDIKLVHVTSRLEVPPEIFITSAGLFSEPISQSFERVTSALDLPPSITLETIAREGKPSREVLRFAREAGADIIVTGSRGAGLMSRLLVGSTATGIIRGADCAVLAVPAALGSDRIVGIGEFSESSSSALTWDEELFAFTKRNAGRRTSLEIDDPDFGVLIQERGYPLRGVAYDRHDERVEIMLGDLEGTPRHLTRGIAHVDSVDVVQDSDGRDRVLRVAHGRGQTLLTLER
ncbi:MAG TPA: universal stress protein [Gemmatimonadaceae bacterium]|nr:universal stress protein [Gemmatimonadaceae bacterium]